MTNYYGQQDGGSASSDVNSIAFMFQRLVSKIRTIDLVTVISCTNSGGLSPVGMVSVQVLVNQMTGNRIAVPHETIYNVPYLRIQGGSSAVILDPVKGDIGMCGFCSRDISAVKAKKGAANPGSFRMFDWADGLYLGGFLNGTPTRYIQFDGSNNVNIKTPSGVVNLNGTTVDSSGNVVIKSGSQITDGAGIVLETHHHNPGTYNVGGSAVTGKSDVPTT